MSYNMHQSTTSTHTPTNVTVQSLHGSNPDIKWILITIFQGKSAKKYGRDNNSFETSYLCPVHNPCKYFKFQ